MATLSPAHSLRSRHNIAAAERNDLEAQHFLTIRQLALILSLGTVGWAGLLAPFLL